MQNFKKVLSECKEHWVVLADFCFLSPQSYTSLHCETMDMGLVHHTVCPFTPQFLMVLIAPTHKGTARLS